MHKTDFGPYKTLGIERKMNGFNFDIAKIACVLFDH